MFVDYAKIIIKSGDGGNGAATFRREKYKFSGVHLPENVEFITDINEDAKRRDFRCNSLYYDILNDSSNETVWYLDEAKNVYIEFFDSGSVSKPNTEPSDMNNSSIAFTLNYLNNKWLFAGDLSTSSEITLVNNIKKVKLIVDNIWWV